MKNSVVDLIISYNTITFNRSNGKTTKYILCPRRKKIVDYVIKNQSLDCYKVSERFFYPLGLCYP